jgi:AraC-like DNA-binding protein
MDDFFKHIKPLARQYPAAAPVQTLGHVPRKRKHVDTVFQTLNISYILRGGGVFRFDGVESRVESPCAFFQWPGERMVYGPDGEWEELFVIYGPEALGVFRASGLISRERPLWPIREPRRFTETLTNLLDLARRAEGPSATDRLDRLSELLLFESLAVGAAAGQAPAGGEQALRAVQMRLGEHYDRDHDIDELALEAGFSPAGFRRRWKELVGVPPHRYLVEQRLAAACRLLVETDQPVGTIARRVGFADPLYFSRIFRQRVGCTATAYRRHHISATGLGFMLSKASILPHK